MNTVNEQIITIYAIKSSKDDRIYVRMSVNTEKRLEEHNSGKTKSTKGFRPWKIIFKEECLGWDNARRREKYWKSGCGKEQLKRLI